MKVLLTLNVTTYSLKGTPSERTARTCIKNNRLIKPSITRMRSGTQNKDPTKQDEANAILLILRVSLVQLAEEPKTARAPVLSSPMRSVVLDEVVAPVILDTTKTS